MLAWVALQARGTETGPVSRPSHRICNGCSYSRCMAACEMQLLVVAACVCSDEKMRGDLEQEQELGGMMGGEISARWIGEQGVLEPF